MEAQSFLQFQVERQKAIEVHREATRAAVNSGRKPPDYHGPTLSAKAANADACMLVAATVNTSGNYASAAERIWGEEGAGDYVLALFRSQRDTGQVLGILSKANPDLGPNPSTIDAARAEALKYVNTALKTRRTAGFRAILSGKRTQWTTEKSE